MSDRLKCYGDVEGPLGFPMREADAKALEAYLDTLPEVEFQRAVTAKATTELSPGERADVSWVSTECLDRQGDVVLAAGMDDSQFKANPIVTMAHDYTKAPVGRSLWRRKVKDGETRGIKAKTVYPPMPEDWNEEAAGPWVPDKAYALVKAGLLSGKSIGFLTIEASPPTEEEVRRNPSWGGARRIVRKWLLLEYACHWLPVNPECVVEVTGKGLATAADLELLGPDFKALIPPPAPPPEPAPVEAPVEAPAPPRRVGFLTEADIRAAVLGRFAALSPEALAQKAVQEGYDRVRGRV